MNNTFKFAYFAGGSFWCTEAIYLRINGVISVVPGYCGGYLPNPTYEQVCSGDSGHAELVKIEYDPKEIDYISLVDIFFNTHDPTTLIGKEMILALSTDQLFFVLMKMKK